MKYALIIDSVACVPERELSRRPIKVLPLTIDLDGVEYEDTTEEAALLPIYSADRIGTDADARSIPPKSDEIISYILKRVATNFDVGVCQTSSRHYTPVYKSCRKMAGSIVDEAKIVRSPLGISYPFRVSVTDTNSIAAGQGLIALYTDDLLSEGLDLIDYRTIIDDFKNLVKSFTVYADSLYARQSDKQRGTKSLNLPVAMMANALSIVPISNTQNGKNTIVDFKSRDQTKSINKVLQYCYDRVLEGLVAPLINISVAGDTKPISENEQFDRLKMACANNDIKLYLGVMTLAASIDLGPNAVSIAIAPINQDVNP